MKERLLKMATTITAIFSVNLIASAITTPLPTLTDELNPERREIGEGTRNLVLCIHGWNYPRVNNRYTDTTEWAWLVSKIKPVMRASTSDPWALVLYDWHEDADTGLIDFFGDDAGVALPQATQASMNARDHGITLGPRLPTSLRQVHIIAHSAGAWCAREVAADLLARNPYVVIQVTFLDPFIPEAVAPAGGVFSKTRIQGLASLPGSNRIWLLENYYADDVLPGIATPPTLGTQEVFSWGSVGMNLQVEWDPDLFHPPGIHAYYDWHSGPTLFYGDTIAAADLGSVSSRLPPSGSPYAYRGYGWYNSLFHRTEPQWATLPRITMQPQNKSAISGASVTLSVQGDSTLPLSYQWFKRGQVSPIPMATGASYTFMASSTTAGEYVVCVSDSSGMIFSDAAAVTVADAPPTPTAPTIASVSPSTLVGLPLPQTQLIRIYGSGFTTSSTLLFNGSITSDPARLYFISPNEIDYYIRTDTSAANWTVKVVDAAQQSNLGYFTVVSPSPITGSLSVTLFPQGAVSAGAQWRVDDGNYLNSGDVATSLSPGSHMISFKAISGYSTPLGQGVNIVANQQTYASGNYTELAPSTYNLTLNQGGNAGYIEKQPLGSGGGTSYSAGAVVQLTANAYFGYHFLGWGGDASGSGSQNPTTITMDGDKTVSANFVPGDPNLGTMVITIAPPEAAASGVTWGLNDNDFRTSGSSYSFYPETVFVFVHGTNGWVGSGGWVTLTAGQTTNVTLTASSTTGSIIGSDPRTYYTFAGLAANSGSADGVGSSARFYHPWRLTVDKGGNVYVADSWNGLIRKITPLGEVTTVAGKVGVSGFADGQGTNAIFNNPTGIAVDSSTNLYVSDFQNSVIRKITPDGTVSTYAGSPGINGSVDAIGSAARFYFPAGVVVDANGNVYVADSVNQTIRKITPSQEVTTIAGSPRSYGSVDGTGNAARFHDPEDVAADNSGNVYVADHVNQTVRKVTTAGVVTTLAGFGGSGGAADGMGNSARFNNLSGITVDSAGDILVADSGNHCIRKVTQAGVVTTMAGQSGNPGDTDGIGSLARFSSPSDVAVDAAGNLFIVDAMNHTIRATRTSAIKFNQSITFEPLADKYINDPPFTLNAKASSALQVTFSIFSGPATLNNNVLTLTGSGTVTVRASQAGDTTFTAAANVDRSFEVTRLPQTITFGALTRQVVGDAPFALSASASSGLPVTFSVLSGPVILSDNVVTMPGAGLAVFRASQSGDATYAPAPNVDQLLIVAPGNNVITDSQRLANGMFTMRYYGDTGTNYVVKASTNLVNWLPIATNQISGLGYLEFTDFMSTNYDRRFYRVTQ